MAIRTFKRFTCDELLVAAQRVSQLLMWKICAGSDGQRRVGSAMVGMTVSAFQVWILVVDGAMQRCRHAHVHCNVDVTEGAAVRHCEHIPRRGVTGFTVADVRVGCHATDSLTRLGVERTRAIDHAALRKSESGYHECRQQCSDDSSWSQATELFATHGWSRGADYSASTMWQSALL